MCSIFTRMLAAVLLHNRRERVHNCIVMENLGEGRLIVVSGNWVAMVLYCRYWLLARASLKTV